MWTTLKKFAENHTAISYHVFESWSNKTFKGLLTRKGRLYNTAELTYLYREWLEQVHAYKEYKRIYSFFPVDRPSSKYLKECFITWLGLHIQYHAAEGEYTEYQKIQALAALVPDVPASVVTVEVASSTRSIADLSDIDFLNLVDYSKLVGDNKPTDYVLDCTTPTSEHLKSLHIAPPLQINDLCNTVRNNLEDMIGSIEKDIPIVNPPQKVDAATDYPYLHGKTLVDKKGNRILCTSEDHPLTRRQVESYNFDGTPVTSPISFNLEEIKQYIDTRLSVLETTLLAAIQQNNTSSLSYKQEADDYIDGLKSQVEELQAQVDKKDEDFMSWLRELEVRLKHFVSEMVYRELESRSVDPDMITRLRAKADPRQRIPRTELEVMDASIWNSIFRRKIDQYRKELYAICDVNKLADMEAKHLIMYEKFLKRKEIEYKISPSNRPDLKLLQGGHAEQLQKRTQCLQKTYGDKWKDKVADAFKTYDIRSNAMPFTSERLALDPMLTFIKSPFNNRGGRQ